jgi:hypothetical protein
MPGLNTSVQAFDRDSGIPDVVWDVLRANAARANVILPHAEKVFSNPSIVSNEFWLVYSKPGTSGIQFVLSCTDGQMGKYPVFIVPILPIPELTPELLEVSMEAFCDALLNQPGFGKRRVYSVFSIDLVAKAFARAWEGRTGINCIEEPYYDAIFTMCSDDTLVRDVRPPRDDVVIELRLAVEQDAQMIGQLCYEFAATSVCLLLSPHKQAFMDKDL